jgi:hypothetical protein
VRAGFALIPDTGDQDDACTHARAHQHSPHGIVPHVRLERRIGVPQQSSEGAGREKVAACFSRFHQILRPVTAQAISRAQRAVVGALVGHVRVWLNPQFARS